jgi:hypothetical protein
LHPSEVVLDAYDVVLAKVRTVLDLDEDNRLRATVFAAVRLTERDVN